ncbi:lovastatin nonaketide synthase [Apiospora marii]|uniref:Lovastatin nonaketide synthase n=1 Tax=Apiospora marii TaxID=335849 RepID=A0ABR1RJN0_9PEZI
MMQPNFGLSKLTFRELGEAVQSIYYIGNEVSLLQTYTRLKQFNVSPVFDVLRLAEIGDTVSTIHYLSTWSVAHLQSWSASRLGKNAIVTSEEELTGFQPPADDELGYFKTRWVAESLLCQAARRGYPVTISRASAVTATGAATLTRPISRRGGDTGIATDPNLDQFSTGMITQMMETGVVPRLEAAHLGSPSPAFAVDVVPVEYLVSALVALTNKAPQDPGLPPAAEIYHIGNPKPLKLEDLPAVILQARPELKSVRQVTPDEWLRTIEAGGNGLVDKALAVNVQSAVLRGIHKAGPHYVLARRDEDTEDP